MPWSSAIRIFTRPRSAAARHRRPGSAGAPAGTSSRDGRALPGPGVDLERAADEQGPLAHAVEAEPLALLGEREPGAVVGDLQPDARVARLEAHLDAGCARSGGPRSRAPPARPGRPRPGRRATARRAAGRPRSWPAPGRAGRSRARACAAPPRGRGRRARSGAAGGRGRAARPSPGWPAAFASASWACSVRRGVLGGRLDAQQQGGERLVDLVVQVARDALALLLLGADAPARPERRRSLSSRSSMRLKRGREPLDVGRHAGHVRVDLEAPARGARGRPAPSSPAAARAARSGAAAAAC